MEKIKLREKVRLLTLMFVVALFSGCSEDDPKVEEPVPGGKGDVLMCTTVASADGTSGTMFMQLIDGIDEAEYDNSNAIQGFYSGVPIIMDNEMYLLPGPTNELDRMDKYQKDGNTMKKVGELALPANSLASYIIKVNEEKAYVSLMGLGKLWIINPSTMTKTGEVDINPHAETGKNPTPIKMLIRDNRLYVALGYISGSGVFASPDRSIVDVLIVNSETDEVEKIIQNTNSGMAMPSIVADVESMFMDENKDIYITCSSGGGLHGSGFLRIKNNETEFDSNYLLSLNTTPIEGENAPLTQPQYVDYAGNGIVYVSAYSAAKHENPPNFYEDRVVFFMEINLYEKTIKKIDLPYSSLFGLCIGKYNNTYLFGILSDKDSGYYTYAPVTGTTSKNAVISVQGNPWFIGEF